MLINPMAELTFRHEPLHQIVAALQQGLANQTELSVVVPDADAVGLYAGEVTAWGVHRPLHVWTDLADVLGAHLLTPQPLPGGLMRLRLRRYAARRSPAEQGYDPTGEWGRVNKLEDPIFLLTFTEALGRVDPPSGGRVLALGMNSGRELQALGLALAERHFDVVGVDWNAEAVQEAARRFPAWRFVQADVMELPPLGQFDLVLGLSLLQSPGVRADVLIASLRQSYLAPRAGLIFGFPNARYRDGLTSYGARMKNFARPDLSLLMSDVTDVRRRLQKLGYKVYVTGKYEVLVTAVRQGE